MTWAGTDVDPDDVGSDAVNELDRAGTAVRRAVLGDAHVDRALAAATPFSAPWQEFVTRSPWALVWARPGLDRHTRSLLTLALLTALGQEKELAMHVRAAVGLGVSAAEISEVLLHTSVYAGVPAANAAFAVTQEVLDAMGVPEAMPNSMPTSTPGSPAAEQK